MLDQEGSNIKHQVSLSHGEVTTSSLIFIIPGFFFLLLCTCVPMHMCRFKIVFIRYRVDKKRMSKSYLRYKESQYNDHPYT